jgi:uncharacterized protein (DUF58 family)
MVAPSWFPLLIFLFVAGAALGAPWLVYFSMAVGVVIGAAHLWTRHALDAVSYRRRFHYRRGFPGENTRVTIEVENRKLLPLSWLRVEDPWPLAAAPEDVALLAPSHIQGQGQLVNVYNLRWYDRARRSLSIRFSERGIYPVGPARIESGDLFGVYSQDQLLPDTEYLTVFPQTLPLETLQLNADDPFGDRPARRPLFEDPNRPMGTRLYHPEDGFRHIHWPATARTGELQTRVYQPVTARTAVICLNVATEQHAWMGYSPPLLEYMVSAAATLCFQGIQAGYTVGLYANGCLAHADQPFRIQPGRTQQHLAALLQALAGVTPYVTQPFENFLLRSLSDIPYGATLVLITALLGEPLQDTLLRMRRYRRNILLYKAGGDPPRALPGIRALHLPFNEAPGG